MSGRLQRDHHKLDTDHDDILKAQTLRVTTGVVAQIWIVLAGFSFMRKKESKYTRRFSISWLMVSQS